MVSYAIFFIFTRIRLDKRRRIVSISWPEWINLPFLVFNKFHNHSCSLVWNDWSPLCSLFPTEYCKPLLDTMLQACFYSLIISMTIVQIGSSLYSLQFILLQLRHAMLLLQSQITLYKGKVSFRHFFPQELPHWGTESYMDASMNTKILTFSNQDSVIIYPPYHHNFNFLPPSHIFSYHTLIKIILTVNLYHEWLTSLSLCKMYLLHLHCVRFYCYICNMY